MEESTIAAQFVGATFAFAASVVLFVITSWYKHLDAQHTLLTAKLEELLASRRAVAAEMKSIAKTMDRDQVKMQAKDKHESITASLVKVILLTKLYFPELKTEVIRFRELTLPFLQHYQEIERRGYEVNPPSDESIDAMNEHLRDFEMKVFCSLDDIVKKPSRLFKKVLY